MQIKRINILKKNRVYFKCISDDGFEYKLKINDLSQDLVMGEHELLVDDISVRSQYGTNVIYEMVSETIKGVTTFRHFRYNALLHERCKELGGRWDKNANAWIFNKIVEDKVDELEEIYNSKIINIELNYLQDMFFSNKPARFCGYVIATATGRDSGAYLDEGVALVEGKIVSAGSHKNWGTEILAGSIIRMQIPEIILLRKLEGRKCIEDSDGNALITVEILN